MSDNSSPDATGFLGKYRNLTASIAALILLIVGLSFFNIFFSSQIQKSAEITSLANSQGVAVQQITKDLFAITSQYQKVLPYDLEKKRLIETMSSFGSVLDAFWTGGVVSLPVETELGLINKRVEVSPIAGSRADDILREAKNIWQGYLRNLAPIIEKNETNPSDLSNASRYAENNDVRLTELMSSLSEEVQVQSEKNLNYLKFAQLAGIVLSILMFLFIIFFAVRNLQKNDRELERAREETTGILNTIREGLFLLDKDFRVSSQYSDETEEIFEKKKIGEQSFTDLVTGILSQSDVETAEEYIRLLFDPHVIVDLIGSLNPLEKVKVTLVREDGANVTKYLNFGFYQVMQDQVIRDVLVSIRDITDEVLLQEQLKNSEEKGEQQVDMLMSFLHANPRALKRFLVDSRSSLEGLNGILKEPVSSGVDFRSKAERMFVEVHRIKGEASSLNFDAFAQKAHEFEEELAVLKSTEYIEGMDFLPLAIRLDNLIQYTDTLQELSERLLSYASEQNVLDQKTESSDQESVVSGKGEWSHLSEMAEKIAQDTGKRVQLVVNGFEQIGLDDTYHRFINDICIQLIRNAIVHGIEDAEERRRKLKSEIGLVNASLLELSDGSFKLSVRDDGKGLNFKKIAQKLVSLGMSTDDAINTWSKEKIAKAAFLNGFSTADNSDLHAGRGVGLNVITERVKAAGGRLKLKVKTDEFCQFEIHLPAKMA